MIGLYQLSGARKALRCREALDLHGIATEKPRMLGEGPTALIGAYEPGPGPGGLRALQPLAGMSVIEYQARRAIEAGAARILLLIDEAPAELSEAIAHLRSDGIQTGMVQGIDQAADALEQDEGVLLIAEGCLPTMGLLRDILAAPMPALGTVPDTAEFGQFERIDAEQRWAGIALLDAHRIAETAAMIGAWDPVSTLLRRAVQEGATRVVATTAPILATDPSSLATAEQAIFADAREPARDVIGTLLFVPVEELAMPLLMARRTDPNLLAGGAAGLALLGGSLAFAGWSWVALLALLLSGPLSGGAARLARVSQRSLSRQRLFGFGRLGGALLGLVGLSQTLAAASGQWGWWLTGAVTLSSMAGLWVERKAGSDPMPIWLASVDTLIWMMLPFALSGHWNWGFGALAVYSFASFAWAQTRKLKDDAVRE